MTGKRPPSRDALCLPPAPFRASASVPQDSPYSDCGHAAEARDRLRGYEAPMRACLATASDVCSVTSAGTPCHRRESETTMTGYWSTQRNSTLHAPR